MQDCFIGIDIGTSSCKVIAVNGKAELIAGASRSYGMIQQKPGWNEQHPQQWWEGTCAALRELMERLSGFCVKGISFSGQMHSMVALDRENRVIRPAILWNDQRTTRQCRTIIDAAGGPQALLRYTNNTMLTGYTGGKLLWLRENEPENFAKTEKILIAKDYIRYLLTGELQMDASDASGTGFFDVKNGTWARELLEKLQLPEKLFPQVVESTAFTGRVTRSAAVQTGLPEGAPVYAGGGDAVLSAIGMGIVDSQRIGVTLGTSGVVATAFCDMPENKEARLQIFRGNTPDRWVSFGCTLSAAGSMQWLKDTLFPDWSFGRLNEAAAAVPDGAQGLIFLPYLNGERCPYFDASAKGAFVGLTGMTTPGHFVRAVMEGVAFSQKQVYEIVTDGMDTQAREIIAAGGGAKSALWRQILANVFQMPVKTVSGSEEGGAFAAALVAMIGCGHFADGEEAVSVIRVETVTQPQPEAARTLEQAYEKYKRMYEALAWSFA